MTTINIILFTIIFLFCLDEDIRVVAFISGCLLFSDYLMWLSSSQYYFERHIIIDMFLAVVCLKLNTRATQWAAIVCIISACTMLFEYLHTYQSPIYEYLNTIQIVLMQLYLLALTYKSEWRIPQCLSRQRKL